MVSVYQSSTRTALLSRDRLRKLFSNPEVIRAFEAMADDLENALPTFLLTVTEALADVETAPATSPPNLRELSAQLAVGAACCECAALRAQLAEMSRRISDLESKAEKA